MIVRHFCCAFWKNSAFFLIIVLFAGCVSPGHQKKPELYSLEMRTLIKSQLYETERVFYSGDYDGAIALASDLILKYRGSHDLKAAQWIIARSYEKKGDLKKAARHYRLFITNFPEDKYTESAVSSYNKVIRRLAGVRDEALRKSLADDKKVRDETQNTISLDDFPLFLQNGRAGIVVPVMGRKAGKNSGLLFSLTADAPGRGSKNTLEKLLDLADKKSLLVFASVDIRSQGWLKSDHPEWYDLVYDNKSGRFLRSDKLDLFAPEVQGYLADMLADLAAYDLAGIVFSHDMAYERYEGFSNNALQLFNKAYDISVTGMDIVTSEELFWRLLGWRSRYLLDAVGKMAARAREVKPQIKVSLVMGHTAIISPASALLDYSYDLLEAVAGGHFDYLIIKDSKSGFVPFHAVDLIGYGGIIRDMAEKIEKLMDADGFVLVEIKNRRKIRWLKLTGLDYNEDPADSFGVGKQRTKKWRAGYG